MARPAPRCVRSRRSGELIGRDRAALVLAWHRLLSAKSGGEGLFRDPRVAQDAGRRYIRGYLPTCSHVLYGAETPLSTVLYDVRGDVALFSSGTLNGKLNLYLTAERLAQWCLHASTAPLSRLVLAHSFTDMNVDPEGLRLSDRAGMI